MKKSELTFKEARILLIKEESVVSAYNTMLSNAKDYFDSNSITTLPEEDQVMFRKVSVCDYHRQLKPDSALTDNEIIFNLQRMDEKFEKEKHEN